MREYLPAIKIFCAFFFGAGLGSLVCGLAARITADKDRYGHTPVLDGLPFAFFSRRPGVVCVKRDRRRLFAELCSAVFCSLFVWRFNTPSALILSLAVLAFLMLHSLTDIENGYIYDLPVLAMTAAGFFLRFWGGGAALLDGALGAAAGFLVIFALRLFTRGGMGSGDAALMLGTGALLGWRLTLIAIYGGFIAGGLFVIPLLLMKKVKTKDAVPLAPFLTAGSLLSVLAGEPVYALMGYRLVWPWPM